LKAHRSNRYRGRQADVLCSLLGVVMHNLRTTMDRRTVISVLLASLLCLPFNRSAVAQSDPLPSWNDGAAKKSITDFVARVTTQGGADFVPPAERIATFDNDGTLWCEQPMYFQAAFALDRVKAMAPQHPEWKQQQPFRAFLAGDRTALFAQGEKGLLTLIMAAHSGMTTDEFAKSVADWLAEARHPRFNRPYNELIYQPMVELLSYLRANGFKTFIVSGGGVEFMRVWTEKAYGIPPEQVVGSSGVTKFEIAADGRPVLMKLDKIEFIDDGPGKPVGINRFIGRRPIFAFGNSDGDLQMLQWTTVSSGARFAGIVHHTDDVREYVYDRGSRIGKLDKAWDEAKLRGWTVVDMKKDWKEIFPPVSTVGGAMEKKP
jgi:phosphoglycolate phosphatase-like HAD superfamily hydrolase